MGRRVSEAQWLAARQLTDIQPPTRARIAAVLGVDVSRVYTRASVEGWRTPDFRNQELAGVYREAQMIAAAIAADKGDDVEIGPDADLTADPDLAADDETAAPPPLETNGLDEPQGGDGGAAPAKAMTPSDFDALDPIELLARASGFVARQVTQLMQNAERRGGRLDKAQVDGLAALSRMMDRWETLAHERAKKEETESDDELAEALRCINDRIVELAREEAARLVDAGYRAPEGQERQ